MFIRILISVIVLEDELKTIFEDKLVIVSSTGPCLSWQLIISNQKYNIDCYLVFPNISPLWPLEVKSSYNPFHSLCMFELQSVHTMNDVFF